MERYKSKNGTFALILCAAVLALSLCVGALAFAADGDTEVTIKDVSLAATDGYEFDGEYWRDKSPQQYYAFTQGMAEADVQTRLKGIKVVYSDDTEEIIDLTKVTYNLTNGVGNNAENKHGAVFHVTATTATGLEIDQDLTLNFRKLENYALVISSDYSKPTNLSTNMYIGDPDSLKNVFNFGNAVSIMRTDGSLVRPVLDEWLKADGALAPTADYFEALKTNNASPTYKRSISISLTESGIGQLESQGIANAASLQPAVLEDLDVSYVAPDSIQGISGPGSSNQIARSDFDYSNYSVSLYYTASGILIDAPAADFAQYITAKYYDRYLGESIGTGKTNLTAKAKYVKFNIDQLPVSNDGTIISYSSDESTNRNDWFAITVEQSYLSLPQLSNFTPSYAEGGVSVTLKGVPPAEVDNPVTVAIANPNAIQTDNGDGSYTFSFNQGGTYCITVTLDKDGDYKWTDEPIEGLNRTLYELEYTVQVAGAPVELEFNHDSVKEYGDTPNFSFTATVQNSPNMGFDKNSGNTRVTTGDADANAAFTQTAADVNVKPNYRLVYSVVSGGELYNNNRYETPRAVGTYKVYVETAETAWYQGAKTDPVEFEIARREIPVGAIKKSAEFTGRVFAPSDIVDLSAVTTAYGENINDVLSLTVNTSNSVYLVGSYGITLALKTGAGELGSSYILGGNETSIDTTFTVTKAQLSFTVSAADSFTYGNDISAYLSDEANLTVNKAGLKGFADVDIARVQFFKKSDTTRALTASSATWETGDYIARYPTAGTFTADGAQADREYAIPTYDFEFTVKPATVNKVTLTKNGASYGGEWSTEKGTHYIWQYGAAFVSTLNNWLQESANVAADGKAILTLSAEYNRGDTDNITVDMTAALSGSKLTLTQAGVYFVTITLNSNYQWSDGDPKNVITYYGAISKAQVSDVAFNDSGETTYNADDQNVSVGFKVNNGAAMWNRDYLTERDVLKITSIAGNGFAAEGLTITEVSNGAFTVKYAGAYTVTLKLADTYNYVWDQAELTDDNCELTYTVKQAAFKASFTYPDGKSGFTWDFDESLSEQLLPNVAVNFYFNGEGTTAENLAVEECKVCLKSDGSSVIGSKITMAGTYYIQVTAFEGVASANYYLPTADEELAFIRHEFTIESSGLDALEYDEQNVSVLYDGTGHRFSEYLNNASAYMSDGVITRLTITVKKGETVLEGNDPAVRGVYVADGTVTAYAVTIKPAGNYKWKTGDEDAEFTFTLTVTQLSVSLKWSNTSMTYGGAQAAAAATVNNPADSSDVVNVTVQYKNGANDITIGSTTNAGKYSAVATALDNDNYTLEGSVTNCDYYVYKQGIAKPVYNGNVSGTYTGASQTTAALYGNSDTLWSSLLTAAVSGKYPAKWFVNDADKQDKAFADAGTFGISDGKLTYTNAGVYTVTFTLANGANYCWAEELSTEKDKFTTASYTYAWTDLIEIARAAKQAPVLGNLRAMEQLDDEASAKFNELFASSDGYTVQYGTRGNISGVTATRQDLTDSGARTRGYYYVLLTLDTDIAYNYIWTVPYDNGTDDGYLGSNYGNNGAGKVFEEICTNANGSELRLYYAITASQVGITFTINNGGYTFGDNGAGYWNAVTKTFTPNDNTVTNDNWRTIVKSIEDAAIAETLYKFTKAGSETALTLVNGLPWEAGTYSVEITIKFEDEDQYQEWSDTLTFTVSELLVQVVWDDAVSADYDGQTHTRGAVIANVAVAEEDAGNKYTVPDIATDSVTDVNYAANQVAPHTITVQSVSDGNYTINGLTDNTAQYTINRKSISVTGKDVAAHVYGDAITDAEKQLTVDGGDFVSGTWSDYVTVRILTDANADLTNLSAVGTYRVVPELKNVNGNYELDVTEGEFKIIKRQITVTIKEGVATSKYGDTVVDLNNGSLYTVTTSNGKDAGLPAGADATAIFNIFVTDINSSETNKPNISSTSIVGNYPIGINKLDTENYDVTLNAATYSIANADITDVNVIGYTGTYDAQAHALFTAYSAVSKNAQPLTWYIQKRVGDAAMDTDESAWTLYVNSGSEAAVTNVLDSASYFVKVTADNHNSAYYAIDGKAAAAAVTVSKAQLTVSVNLDVFFGENSPTNYDGVNGLYQSAMSNLYNAALVISGGSTQSAIGGSIYTVSGLMNSDLTAYRKGTVVGGSISYGYATGVSYKRGDKVDTYALAVDVNSLTSDNYSFAANSSSALTVNALPVTITVNSGSDYTAIYGSTVSQLTVETDVAIATTQTSSYGGGAISLVGLGKDLFVKDITTDALIGETVTTNNVKYDGDNNVVGYAISTTLTNNVTVAGAEANVFVASNTYVINRADNAYAGDYTLFRNNTVDGKAISSNDESVTLANAWTYGDKSEDHAEGYDPKGAHALSALSLKYGGTALVITIYRGETRLARAEAAANSDVSLELNALFNTLHITYKAFGAGSYRVEYAIAQSGNYNAFSDAWYFTVAKQELTITPDNLWVIYGESFASKTANGSADVNLKTAYPFTVSGLVVNGGTADTFDSLIITPNFGSTYAAGFERGSVGTLTISDDTAYTRDNYEITCAAATLTVTARNIEIEIVDCENYYNLLLLVEQQGGYNYSTDTRATLQFILKSGSFAIGDSNGPIELAKRANWDTQYVFNFNTAALPNVGETFDGVQTADAGKYPIYITAGSHYGSAVNANYNVTVVGSSYAPSDVNAIGGNAGTFTVKPAQIRSELAPDFGFNTYDGTAKAYKLNTNLPSNVSVEFSPAYYQFENPSFSGERIELDGAPVNAGYYRVEFRPTSNPNYVSSALGQNYTIYKAAITVGTERTTNAVAGGSYSTGTDGVYFNGYDFTRSVTFSNLQNGEKINLTSVIGRALHNGQTIGESAAENFLTCVTSADDNAFSFAARNAGKYEVTITLADSESAGDNGTKFLASNYLFSNNTTSYTMSLNVLREVLTITSNNAQAVYGTEFDANEFKPTYTLEHTNNAEALLREEQGRGYLKLNNTTAKLYTTNYAIATSRWGGQYNLAFNTAILDAYNFEVQTANTTGILTIKARPIKVTVKGCPENELASCVYAGQNHNHNECLQTTLSAPGNKQKFFEINYLGMDTDTADKAGYDIFADLSLKIVESRGGAGTTPMRPYETSDRYEITFVNTAGDTLSTSSCEANEGKLNYEILPKTLNVVLVQNGKELDLEKTNVITVPYGADASTMITIKFNGWVESEGGADGELGIPTNSVIVKEYDLKGYQAWTSIAGTKLFIKPVVMNYNGNYKVDVDTIKTQLAVSSLVVTPTVKDVTYSEIMDGDTLNYNNGVAGAEKRIDISFTYGNGLALPVNAAEVEYTDTYAGSRLVGTYPTKAGTYNATVTFKKNANDTYNYVFDGSAASKTFADWKVLPKTVSVTWDIPSMVYEEATDNRAVGFVKSLMNVVAFNRGSVSIKDESKCYDFDDNGLTVHVNSMEAGRYDLTVELNENAATNYVWEDNTTGSKVITFNVSIEDNSVTLTVEITDVSFGNDVNITTQEVKDVMNNVIANASVTFTYASINYVDGMENGAIEKSQTTGLIFNIVPRNAGWYVARASYGGSAIYGSAETYYLFRITKAAVEKPVLTTTDEIFTGATLSADIGYDTQLVYLRDFGTAEQSSGNYVTTSLGATVRTVNAGEYAIKLALRDEANYQWSDECGELDNGAVTLTWTIEAAESNPITWAATNTYEADYGQAFSVTATTYFTTSVQYAYASQGSLTLEQAGSIENWNTTRPTVPGTYFVRASSLATNNYPASVDYKIIAINKATVYVIANGTMTYEDKWNDGKFSYIVVNASGSIADITFTGTPAYSLVDAYNQDELSAGTYEIKMGTKDGIVVGLENSNYQAKLYETYGTLVVSPRRITVEIGDAQGFYGETPNLSKVTLKVREQWTKGDVKTVLGITLNPNADATSNAGSYQITATKTNDNYYVTFRNGWYTVNKLNVSVALAQGGGVYGGSIADVRITNVYKIDDKGNKTDIGVDALEFTFRYVGTPNGTTTNSYNNSVAPALAGRYIASVVAIKESDRYNSGNYNLDLNAGEISVQFVIEKKSVDASKLVIESKEYTGENIKPVVTVPNTAEAKAMFCYGDNNLVFTQDDKSFAAVGSHTFELTLVDSNNYQWTSVTTPEREVTFRIVKASNSLVVEGNKNPITIVGWDYGQTPNTPAATIKYGDSSKIVFEYSTEANGSYSYNIPTSAGTYYVRATMPADDNYEAFTSAPVQFAISKSRQDAPTIQIETEGIQKNDVFTGGQLISIIDGFNTRVMDTPRVDGDNPDVLVRVNGGSITLLAVNAGEYVVRIPLLDSDNYDWQQDGATIENGEVVLRWTISKQKAELPAANNSPFYVTGNDITFIPEGFNPAIMNIEGNVNGYGGTFKAIVTLKDTANYEWADNPNRVDVEIEWSIVGINIVFIILICVMSSVCVTLAITALILWLRKRNKVRAEDKAIAQRSKADGWTGEPQAEETTANSTDINTKEGGNE